MSRRASSAATRIVVDVATTEAARVRLTSRHLRSMSGAYEDDAQRRTTEEILPPRKGSRNPWVLVGAGTTALVLAAGFVAFKAGHAQASQRMMRARVLTQGATVALMVATSGAGMFTMSDASSRRG